jgi:hypothetical protein
MPDSTTNKSKGLEQTSKNSLSFSKVAKQYAISPDKGKNT